MRASEAWAFATLLIGCTPSRPAHPAEDARPGAAPHPVVVLLRHSVWYGAVNAPLFIAYDDGRVLYPDSSEENVPITYASAQLGVTGAEAVERTLGIDSAVLRLPRAYDLRPHVTDQQTVFLYVRAGDSLVRFSLRAAEVGPDQLSDSIPGPLRNAFHRLSAFQSANAAPWHSDSLYVHAWPYEYAPDNPPLAWPTTWPNLQSAGTERRRDETVGELITIRLPYADRAALDSLLKLRRPRQAIAISGKKWAVGYRTPFPAEAEWRSQFGRLEE